MSVSRGKKIDHKRSPAYTVDPTYVAWATTLDAKMCRRNLPCTARAHLSVVFILLCCLSVAGWPGCTEWLLTCDRRTSNNTLTSYDSCHRSSSLIVMSHLTAASPEFLIEESSAQIHKRS